MVFVDSRPKADRANATNIIAQAIFNTGLYTRTTCRLLTLMTHLSHGALAMHLVLSHLSRPVLM